MDTPQSINEIIEKKNILKQNISAVDIKQFDGQTFGNEGEYIYKGLLGGIDSLLTDITTLTKAPQQFLKISTYEERNIIRDSLTNINGCLQDPASLFNYLERLKQAIRPFHIRYTKGRLLDFDTELSELTSKKVEFLEQLSSLEGELISSTDNKNKFDEILQALTEQRNNLTDDIAKSQENVDSFNNNAHNLTEIKQQADSQKKLIDNFVAKIAERETQLEDQKTKTNNFNKELEKFTKQRDELLATAESLIKEAKTALGYRKAKGIAAAFQSRLEKLEPNKIEGKPLQYFLEVIKKPALWWIFGATLFAGFAIYLSYEFIAILKADSLVFSFSLVFTRLSIVAIPVAGAWFCTSQYTKLKNIAEDYAYKTVLAQSIVGFSEQLKDDKDNVSYKEYIKKMLDEIHRHPLRNHKKYDKANRYDDFASKITKPNNKNNNDGE